MAKKKTRSDRGTEAGERLPKLKRRDFEAALYKLQVELTRLQAWALGEGAHIIVIFEGRDTDDKRRARLNLIHHMLEQIPYRKIAPDLPRLPRVKPRPTGLEAGLGAGQVVENRY